MSSLNEPMRGVKPACEHTAVSSARHRSHPPIQAESRWFARLSPALRLIRWIGSSVRWRKRNPSASTGAPVCRKTRATSISPCRSSFRASTGCSSTRLSRRPGCARASAVTAAGTIVLSTDALAARRTRPVCRPTCAASSVDAASTRPTISAARPAGSRPSGVRRIPRPIRCTSLTPVAASSRDRWWLTDGCEQCSSRAASVTDSCRATAARTLRWTRFSGLRFILVFDGPPDTGAAQWAR